MGSVVRPTNPGEKERVNQIYTGAQIKIFFDKDAEKSLSTKTLSLFFSVNYQKQNTEC